MNTIYCETCECSVRVKGVDSHTKSKTHRRLFIIKNIQCANKARKILYKMSKHQRPYNYKLLLEDAEQGFKFWDREYNIHLLGFRE